MQQLLRFISFPFMIIAWCIVDPKKVYMNTKRDGSFWS